MRASEMHNDLLQQNALARSLAIIGGVLFKLCHKLSPYIYAMMHH